MRAFAPMLLLLTLAVCFAADKQGENLKSLYDAHRWFELRDAVAKGGAPAFYQGVVACALNDLRECKKKLQPVFESEPHSEQAVEAHRTLASAYLTHGDYKRTLAQVDALLGIRPDDSDASGDRTLLAELARFLIRKSHSDTVRSSFKMAAYHSQFMACRRRTGSTRARNCRS